MARPTSREKILDSAEALFAERGLAAVSLRAINAAAGLSPAALHYHFGTKQILVEAILLRRMPELMAKRGALLEELASSVDPPDARAVVGAFLLPLIELLLDEPEAGRRYVRFLARALPDGDVETGFVLARFEGDVAKLDPLLQRALPELPIDLVRVRLGIAIESGLHALANADAYSTYGPLFHATQELSPEQFANVLLDFIAGGLGAPSRLAETPIPTPHDFVSPPQADDAWESKPGGET
jgi:AcrR family transcriptional regulator